MLATLTNFSTLKGFYAKSALDALWLSRAFVVSEINYAKNPQISPLPERIKSWLREGYVKILNFRSGLYVYTVMFTTSF